MLRIVISSFAWLVLGGAMTVPGFGLEAVFLTNGFRLDAASHVRNSDQSYLFTLETGTIELRASEVQSIEVIDLPEPARESLPAVPPPRLPSTEELLTKAGTAQGLPPDFMLSVAKVESGFRQEALSPKGARGLMQLMPQTSSYLGVKADIPGENALGGAKYLRELLVRYRGNTALALAAYNAGPGAVARFGGVPPYDETRRYIDRVLREYDRRQKMAKSHDTAILRNELSRASN